MNDNMKDGIVLISTTVEKKADAERLSALLIEKRLVACAQISAPMTSIYRWQGKIVTAEEYLLTVKTRKSLYGEIEQLLKDEHPYETPEILGQEIMAVSESYELWVKGETA